jgi:hypothetical protein
MRSLIIHQYIDNENDKKAGVRTFVNNTTQMTRYKFQGFVLLIEILSFMVFILTIDYHIFLFPIFIYVLFLVVLKVIYNLNFYFFAPLQNKKSRSLFFDFYVSILPFALLVLLTLKNYENGLLLIVSIFLFNIPTLFNAMNFFKVKN